MMLVASVLPALRPRSEGMSEIAMGVAAGSGAPLADLLLAVGDFTALVLAGAAAGAVPVALAVFAREPQKSATSVF